MFYKGSSIGEIISNTFVSDIISILNETSLSTIKKSPELKV